VVVKRVPWYLRIDGKIVGLIIFGLYLSIWYTWYYQAKTEKRQVMSNLFLYGD
jgi:hypothetical protein